MNILIWWTNEADCRAIEDFMGDDVLPLGFPTYLRDQYRSRLGRNGRGRLWAGSRFRGASVDPWPDTAMGKILGEEPYMSQTYAGIVIDERDVDFLDDMPGIVTDMQLRRYLGKQERAKGVVN